jgi:hypothetical protein
MPQVKPMPAVQPMPEAQPLPKPAATEDPANAYYPTRNGEQSLRQNRLGDLFGAPN